MKLLISSIGRRNYLIDWFRDAARLLMCDLEIIGADNDPMAPGLLGVDKKVILPPISSSSYLDELLRACIESEVGLMFSLHDYDIGVISNGGLAALHQAGVITAIPPVTTMDIANDKLATVEHLSTLGFSVPATRLGDTDLLGLPQSKQFVVKHRYGSGSSGLFRVQGSYLPHAVAISALTAPMVDGGLSPAPDHSLVLIQDAIEGEEYGIDLVCDFEGSFQGALARRKLRMRAGETDRAVTVEPEQFREIAQRLSSGLEFCGSTDLDMIVTPEGEQYIIDINPRFGGGYPFVHVAGAHIPACYLTWALGKSIDPNWLKVEPGVVSSKYQAIQRLGIA